MDKNALRIAVQPPTYRSTMAILAMLALCLFDAASAYEDYDYQDGEDAYWQGDYEKALDILRPLANEGDVRAQFRLGYMYDEGKGVNENDREGRKWYLKAAKQGHVSAQYNLGVMYDNGSKDVPEDDKEARKWYLEAAKQGHVSAQYNLGVMYGAGEGGREDDKEALMWYRKAAKQGHEVAQFAVGWMYENGKGGVTKNYIYAYMWYTIAAESGNKEARKKRDEMAETEMKPSELDQARASIGVMYYEGKEIPKNNIAAYKWWKIAVAYGKEIARDKLHQLAKEMPLIIPQAEYELGLMYEEGKDFPKNNAKAERYFHKVAEKGYDPAQYKVGDLYYDKRDYTEAYVWWSLAAEQGNKDAREKRDKMSEPRMSATQRAEAHNRLGMKYYKGEDVPKNYKTAMEHFRKAADQGHVYAQYNLGWMYEKGQGVSNKDYIAAYVWFSLATEQGYEKARERRDDIIAKIDLTDLEVQNELGGMYYKGEKVLQDYEKALEWFRKAAKQGYEIAQYSLGMMYYNGDGIPKRDYKAAIEWFYKAAEQEYVHAQYVLGDMYYNGHGIPKKDYITAYVWFSLAVEQGHEDAHKSLDDMIKNKKIDPVDAETQNSIGVTYHNGEKVPRDYEKAIEWYHKAAEQEYVYAQYNLGLIYKEKKDYRTAYGWYHKAANQGYADAQFALGKMFESEFVGANLDEAIKWYEKAAMQGPSAMQRQFKSLLYNLGKVYSEKYFNRFWLVQYFHKDEIIAAYKWWNLAAELGDEDARKELNDIGNDMTPSETEEARKQAEKIQQNWRRGG